MCGSLQADGPHWFTGQCDVTNNWPAIRLASSEAVLLEAVNVRTK